MKKEYKYLVIGILLGSVIVYSALRMVPEPEHRKEVEAPETITKPNIYNQQISGYGIPEQPMFAGEMVPIDRPEVYEKLDREIQVNAFWHSNSILLIKRSAKWLPTIDSILNANDIPADFKYLSVAESGLQNVISPKKAVGFWQLLKGTAKDFGLEVNPEVDERYDAFRSTVAATKYLKQAYEKYGNWTMVAASYNLGMRATSEISKNQRALTYYDMILSEEPSRYIFRILAIKDLLENPEKYGFDIASDECYQLPEFTEVSVNESINWHEFAENNATNYYQLKMLNPWIRNYQLTVKKGKSYQVKLPIKSK